jgi:hypothetical protein
LRTGVFGKLTGSALFFVPLVGIGFPERDDLPCRYGLLHPQTSYNPLRVEFDAWIRLACDVCGARSLRSAAAYLVMPPGWQPDGNSETAEALRQRASALPREALQ